MSKFELWINTDNAAFADGEKPFEVARILREIADKIDGNGALPDSYKTIHDINGNDVGRYAEKSAD